MDALGFPHSGHAIEADLALGLERLKGLTHLSQNIGYCDRADLNVGLGTDAVVELNQVHLLPAQPFQAGLHRLDDARFEVVGVGLAQAVLGADVDLV